MTDSEFDDVRTQLYHDDGMAVCPHCPPDDQWRVPRGMEYLYLDHHLVHDSARRQCENCVMDEPVDSVAAEDDLVLGTPNAEGSFFAELFENDVEDGLRMLIRDWRDRAYEDAYEDPNGPNHTFAIRECADELEALLDGDGDE